MTSGAINYAFDAAEKVPWAGMPPYLSLVNLPVKSFTGEYLVSDRGPVHAKVFGACLMLFAHLHLGSTVHRRRDSGLAPIDVGGALGNATAPRVGPTAAKTHISRTNDPPPKHF